MQQATRACFKIMNQDVNSELHLPVQMHTHVQLIFLLTLGPNLAPTPAPTLLQLVPHQSQKKPSREVAAAEAQQQACAAAQKETVCQDRLRQQLQMALLVALEQCHYCCRC